MINSKLKQIIQLNGINKTYNGCSIQWVLKNVSLCVLKGEVVAIMGTSGSGKSTLLNIICTLDTFDSGTYFLNGISVNDMNTNQKADLRNRTIGFIFQSYNLIPHKTVLENVELPLVIKGEKRKNRQIKSYECLRRVGMVKFSSSFPTELSGGQKQRVAIARALVMLPQIILADEPTGALDSENTKEVMQLLLELNREYGITILIVTHEQSVANMCNRVLYIWDGKITELSANQNF